MNEKNPKSQIASKIKDSTNILVTVSRNPSVDELSAALALTFTLDKLGKHATAVFSGEIPPAIQFLEPEKTFEDSTSSLRDFIISLDKEKADRLRYKVEDDVVKIFITPYKTKITEKDLEFSEGDFNVELVIAIGVDKKDELDQAIASHGRILHDATVATINQEAGKTNGLNAVIEWADASACGYGEIVASLIETLKDKDDLVDAQIATALLTGIVSATDQFRNGKTSPRVMTLAAQLMGSGANQQLIAVKLAESTEEEKPTPATQEEKPSESVQKPEKPKKQDGSLGEMSIDHDDKPVETAAKTQPEKSVELDEKSGDVDMNTSSESEKPVAEKTESTRVRTEKASSDDALAAAEAQLSAAMKNAAPPEIDVKAELQAAADQADKTTEAPKPDVPLITAVKSGGSSAGNTDASNADASLNAMTTQAKSDNRDKTDAEQAQPILSHTSSYVTGSDPNALAQGADNSEPPSVDLFAKPPSNIAKSDHAMIQSAPAPKPAAPVVTGPSLEELQAAAFAQAAPSSDGVPTDPSPITATVPDLVVPPTPVASNDLPPAQSVEQPITPPMPPANFGGFADLPAPPPIPDFSQMTSPTPVPEFAPPTPTQQDVFTPDMNAPQNPLFPAAPPPIAPAETEPGQFRIPGQ